MGPIQRAETETYADVWGSLSAYGEMSPGERWAALFADLAGRGGSVLDAGCGSGKGAVALEQLGYRVAMCDLTAEGLVEDARHIQFESACLWSDLRRVSGFKDWVFCCDVLEHIPPEFTMLTIARMLEVARNGLFCSITFVPDHFGVFLGRPLHQTVEPFTWWKQHLGELGTVVEARDCLQFGIFMVRPKR